MHKRIKINAPLIYEVLDKFTITFEIQPHLSVTKRYYIPKWAVGSYSVHSLQVESGFSVEYNEEKVKITSNR